MKTATVALCLFAAAGVSEATVMPQPGSGDPRIQAVDYDPQQVVTLVVATDFALTLEFSPDERIENVAVGDSNSWQVTPNKGADHLFIKSAAGATSTDMTVITDVRSYNFDLRPLPTPTSTTPILVRFRFPQATVFSRPATAPEPSYYRFTGERLLHPVDMRDNGQATYILWGPTTPIPAVFIVEPDGRMTLADGAMRDGRLVIDRVGDEFIFRLGLHEERARRYARKVHSR